MEPGKRRGYAELARGLSVETLTGVGERRSRNTRALGIRENEIGSRRWEEEQGSMGDTGDAGDLGERGEEE